MRAPASGWLALALLGAGPCLGQTDAPWRLQARVGASLTVSDQIALLPGGGSDRGAVFSLTPGVSMATQGAQLSAKLSYDLGLHAPWRVERSPQRLQHTLRADLNYRPADTGLGLTVQGSIGQQQQSTFGVQRPLGSVASPVSPFAENSAEVYSLSATPTFQARLGNLAQLVLSHRLGATNTKGSVTGDAITRASSAQLSSAQRGLLGWSLLLSDSESRPKQARVTRSQIARGSLSWRPDIDWDLGVSAGAERSDLRTAAGSAKNGAIYGANLGWRPTPRTRLSLVGDHRVDANTYNLSLDHRFSRSSIRVSESRSLNQPGVVGAASTSTYYELLFAQLAATEPDPLRREALVLAQLQQLGLSRDTVVSNGFIAGGASLSRQSLIAGSWQIQRSSWSLNATRSRSTRLGAATNVNDDFATSTVLESLGAGLSVAYRLNPVASLNLGLQWQRNDGDRAELRNELRSLMLGWTTRLGLRQQLSLNLRHSNFDSPTRPYDENAIVLSYLHTF